jgi:hypothetical protein
MNIQSTIKDPAASDWLKTALRSALTRDPLDAANDAAALSLLLSRRSGDVLSAELNGETSDLAKGVFQLAANLARMARVTASESLTEKGSEMLAIGRLKEDAEKLGMLVMFPSVSCSQCGRDFGPGEHGFSSCDQHPPRFRP